MKTSIARALRGPLVTCLLAFSALAALAAAGYTPEERKLVDKLPALFQAKCIEGAVSAQRDRPPEDKALADPMMEAMRGPDGTCACVSAEVMRHVTPELLHSPDAGPLMTTYTTDAGALCMARMVRTVFPALCPAVVGKALAKHSGEMETNTDAYVPGMCQCIQRRMDALSPTDLRPYIQALMSPANRDRSTRDVALQTLPSGFATDMRECGTATANQIVDAETAAANAKASADQAAAASAAAR